MFFCCRSLLFSIEASIKLSVKAIKLAPTQLLHVPDVSMTHLSNNIQDIHDKIQPTLSHTVEKDARFNSTDNDCSFLDRTLHKITAESAELDSRFHKLGTMGSALKKHKKDLKCATNNNKDTTVQNHKESKKTSQKSDELPALIVSDTTTGSDKCVLNCENFKSDHHKVDDVKIVENAEQDICSMEVEQTPSNVNSKLNPDESSGQSKRDSAYGSSPDSSCQVSATSDGGTSEENAPSDCIEVGVNLVTKPKSLLSDPNFPSALLANKWSSSSSIASDGSTSPVPHDCENSNCSSLLSSKEPVHIRNLSSSSSFSLR